jgi:hypothetical protein
MRDCGKNLAQARAECRIEDRKARLLAEALYAALEATDPSAFISGSPCDPRVVIDGEFNLLTVARRAIKILEAVPS